MIIHSLCNTCFQPFQLIVTNEDVPLVKDISDEEGNLCPCPRLCGGMINLTGDPVFNTSGDRRFREPMMITGKQLYKAVKGAGLPDEIPKDKEVVSALLKAHKIEKVDLEENQGKVYLHELSLEGGITIHLAAGIKGAQVLKVTKNGS